jgi:hypothetical protein
MTDNFGQGFTMGIIVAAVISFLIHMILLANNVNTWHKTIIEKGFAEYNQVSGEWQWKEIKK